MSKLTGFISKISLTELLECPVCLSRSNNCQYEQCHNGHYGCKDCFSRLALCPVCRCKLPLKRIQTITAKKSLDILLEEDGDFIPAEHFVSLLKCTNCSLIPTQSPVMQCCEGDIVCALCQRNKEYCNGLCTFGVWTRALFAEQLLSKFEKPCRYEHFGCDIEITDLSHHEMESCEFRETDCVFVSCSQRIPLNNVFDHFKLKEHEHFLKPLEANLSGNGRIGYGSIELQETPYCEKLLFLRLNTKDNFFFGCFGESLLENCYLFYALYVGSAQEARKFKYELKISGKSSKNSINVSGPVEILTHRFFKRKYYNPNIYQLPLHKVKRFFSQDDLSLSWEVSIKEKENENDGKQLTVYDAYHF